MTTGRSAASTRTKFTMLRILPAGKAGHAFTFSITENAPRLPFTPTVVTQPTPGRGSLRKSSPIWKPGNAPRATLITIRGRVLDPQDQPVVEAAVYLVSAPVPMPDIAQLTDEEGRFAFAAPSPGPYTIGVHSDRWGTTQKMI